MSKLTDLCDAIDLLKEELPISWLDHGSVPEAVPILIKGSRAALELYKALRQLTEQLDEINHNESFKGVWTFAHLHGYKYSGPTYEGELNQAMDVLKEVEYILDE